MEMLKSIKPPLYVLWANFSEFKDYINVNKDNYFSFVNNDIVEDSWTSFLSVLKEGLAKFIPIKNVRECKEPRWVKSKLQALYRKQRFLHVQIERPEKISENFEIEQQKYEEVRKLVEDELQNEFQDYRSKTLLESLGSDQTEFWSYVQERWGGQSSVTNLVNDKGLTISKSLESKVTK